MKGTIMDRFFPFVCTLLFIAGMVVLGMDLWVWRPN
jgi:hypothetical protein